MPRWLARIIRRGLAQRPADRYSSMTALLEALMSGRRRSRNRVTTGTLLVGVGLTAGLVMPGNGDSPCEAEAEAKLAEVWGDAERRAGAAAFAATRVPDATAACAWAAFVVVLPRPPISLAALTG